MGGDGGGRKRRWWLYILVAPLVLVVGWTWWVPRYRPSLEDGERYGVDVSHHQGEIDWDLVADDDIGFAYIKATEGGDHVDRWFEENWDQSRAAGLDRGAYHFFTLCRPGREQADNFLDTVPDDPHALPPAIDLELSGNCSDRPDREWVKREVEAFIVEVEASTGQPVVLYVGPDFDGRYHLRDELDRPFWHRRIMRRPDVAGWWIWQFTYRASVDGIDGGADLNIMRGDPPTLDD